MIRPFELFIGLRYTRAKRRNHFISFISLSSMMGITVGVWALITVLSVMNGFERELRDRILSVASHVTISGFNGWLSDWREVSDQATQHPSVVGKAPYILGQGMLSRGSRVTGALIRGIDPMQETTVSDLESSMKHGTLTNLVAGDYGVVLGSALAWQLRVDVGDKLMLVAPAGQVTPVGLLPRLKRFTVVGIFELDMYEYDSGLALIHISDAGKLYRSGEQVSGIRLKLDDIYFARQVNEELQGQLNGDYAISDWTREHTNFFKALKVEKRVMFIILLLIVAVAAFNIVSTLVMVVTDKRADIAILRTLGVSPASVMGVFVVQGTIIGFVGTLLGGILGVITALNIETLVPFVERLFSIEFFPADVYVLSEFPADMRWADVIKICTASFLISLVATLYPAWRGSRTQPAEALRYE
ncbi:MAG: lipoprotein-releasing ABC transporter permease subunit [Gammaproteobacteria bacterium]|nr:lipoprotein-releasing ABC transporter permease subunit [Gammaproteobacteria bacterium]